MSQTTGRYEQVNGNAVVRFERTFPHPVPVVWDAITDPEQLEAWFPTTVAFSSLSAGSVSTGPNTDLNGYLMLPATSGLSYTATVTSPGSQTVLNSVAFAVTQGHYYTVVVFDSTKNEEITYKLVTSEESDVSKGLISTTSPIGRSLVGKQVGDTAEVVTPNGKRELEVLKLQTIHESA